MANRAPGAARSWRRSEFLAIVAQGLLVLGVGPAGAADPDLDNRGFNARREFVSQLPFEHVDPMTGNVVLTFTDLVLPGNAGFDLRVQRTYNSKIYADYSNVGNYTLIEDSWAGLGWTLHFGHIPNLNSTTAPIVEMSDGSQHRFFRHMDGTPNHFMSRDFWTLERYVGVAARLRAPSGIQYDFNWQPSVEKAYATEIRDPFGNKLVVKYCGQTPRNTTLCPGTSPAGDAIEYVEQQLVGGQTRRIEFTTQATIGGSTSQNLQKMRYRSAEGVNHDWTYTQTNTPGSGWTLLTAVQPPEGLAWAFTYYPGSHADVPYSVQTVTTPNGGGVSYQYQRKLFHLGSSPIYTPALYRRSTSGRDVPAGDWIYSYFSQINSSDPLRTEIQTPCGSTLKQFFANVGGGQGERWQLGALIRREIWDGATKVEEETQTWRQSKPISLDTDGGLAWTYAALPYLRTLTRFTGATSATWTTTQTYHDQDFSSNSARNFNDFGRAETTTETGQLSRKTEREFFYPQPNLDPSFGTFIVDRVRDEGVRVPASSGEVFTKTYAFDPDGFKRAETVLGITTQYQPQTVNNGQRTGNVYRVTDANNRRTTYLYTWGVPWQIQTAKWTITRSINSTGTIAWERRLAADLDTTSFTYDRLFRLQDTNPPLGHTTTREYATDGTYARVYRGPSNNRSVLTTHLDGYGRESWTENSLGIKTDRTYDACGRVFYESYPYEGASNIGTTYQLDALGRVVSKTNPDATSAHYQYSNGIDVEVTDEENHSTRYDFSAFGNSDDSRLMSVLDAGSGAGDARQTTTYAYNALGSLTSVTHPTGLQRNWQYYGANEPAGTHGLLKSDSHPEAGTTSYKYYPAGNLKERTDASGRVTTYTYDSNNRLTRADRPGSTDDATFDYDDYDQRTVLNNGAVQSRFEYDAARRLRWRWDTIQGRRFTTGYRWDDHDNLEWIDYPSGSHVKYAYDNERRITSVSDGAGHWYATSFQYHPSGGVTSFTAGNGFVHQTGYHPQRYWVNDIRSLPAAGFHLHYWYDDVGNAETITDDRAGFGQSFTHDRVDRVKTAGGPWGAAAFTYDPLGNRTSKTVGATTTYAYDSGPGGKNRLNSSAGSEPGGYTYDDVGNLLTDPAGTYTYTGADMLKTSTSAQGPGTYAYDGDDLRKVRVQMTEGGPDTRYFVHGLGGQILTEFQRQGSNAVVFQEYVYAGSRLLTSLRPPTLRVDPSQLTFATNLGGPVPPAQALNISEGGSWQATETLPWLTLSATSGSSPETITVSANHAGLAVGTYYGEIVFTAAGAQGSPVTIPVRLVITAGSGLVIEPSGLHFVVQVGGVAPPPQYLDVLWSGPLPELGRQPVQAVNTSWTATTSSAWLQVSPTQGTTPSTITVNISPTGLQAGRYDGWINIDSPDDSRKTVPVDLLVEAGPGEPCAADAWFCETFDDRWEGNIGGQGSWTSEREPGQVAPDPRGLGNSLLLDPPPGGQVNDMVTFPDQATRGIEISLQVMAQDVPADSRQIGKIEFFTTAGSAWGKTGRTFGALRFGSMLYLQYGPNINQVVMDRLEPGQWYSINVVYDSQRIEAFVDGVLRFSVDNPLALGVPFQAFATTAWEFPGQAYLDRIQARNLPTGLVVRPQELHFTAQQAYPIAEAPPPTVGATRPHHRVAAKPAAPAPGKASVSASSALGRLPMAFEPNLGQTDPSVRFLARGAGYDVFLTDDAMRLRLARAANGNEPAAASSIGVRLVGAKKTAEAVGVDPLPGVSNYFLGNDPSKWRTRVPHFRAVKMEDVYPGIDLVLYGNQGRLEYDLRVGPGADPDAIRLAFDGVEDVRLDPSGDIVLRTPGGEVRQLRPVVYQEIDGLRHRRDVAYVLDEAKRVAVKVANYDPERDLVIDPVLSYSTYWGDMSTPYHDVHVGLDGTGAIYLAGWTDSPNFPVFNAFQPQLTEPWAGFLTKLTPDGLGLVYSTYMSGAAIKALAISEDGSAYLAGRADSNLPLANPLQGGPQGAWDPFVTRLSTQGSELVYSTHLGLDYEEAEVRGIALDASGAAHIVGAYGDCAPLAGRPASMINPGLTSTGADVFVARLTPTGSDLPMHTCLNGADSDGPGGIAVVAGGVFVGGWTMSPVIDNAVNPFPASQAAFDTSRGGPDDGFVAFLSADGASLLSTLLGGDDESSEAFDSVVAVAVEPGCLTACAVYAAGWTRSDDFPQSAGTIGEQLGPGHAFVTKFSSLATYPAYSTTFHWYGGSFDTSLRDLAVDGLGRAHVTGMGMPLSLPPAACADRVEWGTGVPNWPDIYVARLAENASRFDYCAFLKGTAEDSVTSLDVDDFGGAVLAGSTSSLNFPITLNAIQPNRGSMGTSAFVAGIGGDITTTPMARIQFRLASYSVQEDGGQALITVLRSGVVETTASVDYATQDGSAQEGSDYTATSGTLTFDPGETILVIPVPLVNDLVPEDAESFTLTLSDPSQGAAIGGIPTTTVEIEDDDDLSRIFTVRDRVLAVGPNWQAVEDIGWLVLDTYSGVGPSNVIATANPAGLPPGTYDGVITVTGDTGDSPQFVHVHLTVQSISDLIFKDGFETAPVQGWALNEPGRPYRPVYRHRSRPAVGATEASASVASFDHTPDPAHSSSPPPAVVGPLPVGTADLGPNNPPLPARGERDRVRGASFFASSNAVAASTYASPTALSPRAPQVEQYYHLDALGSVRVVTDTLSNIVERHDYLPFGEECLTPPCTPLQGTNTRKFTGKERDAETGLDYFGARYYGSRIGRFTTVDPVYTWQENLVDPQRWNRYAYGRNNPLRFVDPDGRDVGEAAAWVQGQVTYASNYYTSAAVGTGNPFVAGPATFAASALELGINGVADAFRVGESTGAALGRGDSGLALAAAVSEDAGRAGGLILMAVGAARSPGAKGAPAAGEVSTLSPGPFAGESISLRGPGRNFSAAERAAVDKIGSGTGCHTCGTKTAGTKSGHFIVDHQPPVGLSPGGAAFRGYPHCKNCSFPRQANEVKGAQRQSP